MAWRSSARGPDLVETAFGVVFLVKIRVVAITVAVARVEPVPALTAHPEPRAAAGTARRRFGGAVRVEASLLVVVPMFTGVLVNRTPETNAQAAMVPAAGGDPDTVSATAGNIQVVALVHPQTVGRNTIVVQIQDTTGGPVEP